MCALAAPAMARTLHNEAGTAADQTPGLAMALRAFRPGGIRDSLPALEPQTA